MEVHGVGLVEKVYDIAVGLVMAMNSSAQLELDTSLGGIDVLSDSLSDYGVSVRELLQRLEELIQNFRGGDHEYVAKFAMALGAIRGYYPSTG